MTITRRNLLGAGAAFAVMAVAKPAQAGNVGPWIPKFVKDQLPLFGVNPLNLQWDKLRARDMAPTAQCAGLTDHAAGPLSLFVVSSRNNVQVYENVTPAQAARISKGNFLATSVLMEEQSQGYKAIAIYQVNGHKIQHVARPQSKQPFGDFTASSKVCNSLQINS